MIRIGPMTDAATVETLVNDTTGLRKILAENPEAVTVLKKCASPCLPSFIKPEEVLQVERIMKGKSREDLLRIREYLYGLRSDEAQFKNGLNMLEADAKTALKDVKVPVIDKPAALKVSDEALRRIVDLGLSISELNKIMRNASKVKAGDEVITDLLRVLELKRGVSLTNFDRLTAGLGSTQVGEFRTAQHLLDEAERFNKASKVKGLEFRYTGLQKADKLLGKFSLAEMDTLMRARWSNSFVNTLNDLSEMMPGVKNAEIIELANKAGTGGKANLGRLKDIVDSMRKTEVTYDEALKAIEAANAFGAEVSKAMKDPKSGFDALVKLIWGENVTIEDGVIKVKDAFAGGSETISHVTGFGKADKLAEGMITGTKVDSAKWEVFRRVIDQSDIAVGIKNNIIGTMWERVNIKAFEKQGYTVYTQVMVSTGKTTAKVDAVLLKGNEIIFVELKSGGAVYERGQKVIYPLLEQGKFKNVMITNDEALAAKFADPKFKIKFRPVKEAEVIAVH